MTAHLSAYSAYEKHYRDVFMEWDTAYMWTKLTWDARARWRRDAAAFFGRTGDE